MQHTCAGPLPTIYGKDPVTGLLRRMYKEPVYYEKNKYCIKYGLQTMLGWRFYNKKHKLICGSSSELPLPPVDPGYILFDDKIITHKGVVYIIPISYCRITSWGKRLFAYNKRKVYDIFAREIIFETPKKSDHILQFIEGYIYCGHFTGIEELECTVSKVHTIA